MLSELSIVDVYELPDRFFLHRMALTTVGFWLAVPPGQRLEVDISPEALGAAVWNLVKRTPDRVPTPKTADYPNLTRPILEGGGVKSWLSLERKARLCQIVRKQDELLVIPTEVGGTRGKGFHRLEQSARALKLDVTPEELGRAIIEGLAKSRGATARGPAA